MTEEIVLFYLFLEKKTQTFCHMIFFMLVRHTTHIQYISLVIIMCSNNVNDFHV